MGTVTDDYFVLPRKLTIMRRLFVLFFIILTGMQLTGCTGMGAMSAILSNSQEEYIKNEGGRSAFDKLDPLNMAILCSMYAQVADLQAAEDCSARMIARFENSRDKETLYHLLSSGYVIRIFSQMERGMYKETVDTVDKAIAIIDKYNLMKKDDGIFAGNFKPFFVRTKYDMHDFRAIAYYRLGKKFEAERELNKVVQSLDKLDEQLDGMDFMKEAVINGLARAFALMGRFVDAANLYVNDDSMSAEEIIKSRERYVLMKPLHKFTDVSLYYIAKSDMKKGNHQRSLTLFKELESYDSITRAPVLHWKYWYDYANLMIALKDIDGAIDKLNKAVEVVESQRSTLRTEVGKIGFVGNKQKVYSLLISLLLDRQQFDEAFVISERAKSRALVDLLAQKKQIRGGHKLNTKKAESLVSELALAELKYARLIQPKSSGESERALILKKKKGLKKLYPEMASLITVETPDLKKIQSLLPENEVLIEYYGNSDDLYAFVVTHDSVHGSKLNGEGLYKSVSSLRKALQQQDPSYKDFARALYARLIRPLEGWIKYNNLTVVPHGVLHYLPFNALVAGNEYVLEKYNIRALPSASVMPFLNKIGEARKSIMVVGNPDLGNRELDLPGAEKEAKTIANIEPNAMLLLRNKATETEVRKQIADFRRVHIASHGVFAPDSPLSSGLMLVRDNMNDGVLTVEELYDLNLNADLVTLSACETALGKIASGDDVVGFTRGFLYAGAKSIVSSLWKVDDKATEQLMRLFYRELKDSDKRTALRNAQLRVKKRFAHPYYWAAFQLTGAVI